MQYNKVFIVLFISFLYGAEAKGTPDLVVEPVEVVYRTLEGIVITVKLSSDAKLLELSYCEDGSVSYLPEEVRSKISGVDIYTVSITYSLGIKGTASWQNTDEKYIYLKFSAFSKNGNINKGDFELKAVFHDSKFKNAIVLDSNTNLSLYEHEP